MPDYVDWFVNRQKQFQGFLKMLARQTLKIIMIIEAPADMGKTWVIQHMRQHCDDHNIPSMHVDFRDRRPHDYLSLVRLARDQMSNSIHAHFFNALTATINSFTSVNVTLNTGGSGNVNIAEVQGSVAFEAGGDVAGRDVIKDNQFYIQADSKMAQRAAEIQINDAFFACLDQLAAAAGPLVFLFDTYENATSEADRWLHEYLLVHLREKQTPNMLVVIAGRKTPEMPPELKGLVARTGLDLLVEEDVREYIEDRRKLTGLDLQTVYKTCGGLPGLLAKMADLASLETRAGDDEWL